MRRATYPVWAVLITVAAMFAQILVGTAPVSLLLSPDHPLYRPLGMIGITLASLGLVYLIRRFLGGQSWAGVGLEWSRRLVPHLLLGVLAGAVPVVAAGLLSVALGVASAQPWELTAANLGAVLFGMAFALLSQAFPEELLWRGHLFDTLSGRLSPRAVLIVVSVGFGLLHLVSNSPAATVPERLLYAVHAIALGFACAAARARTGTVWMAVGVHTGLHTGYIVFPTAGIQYGVQLVILTCALTLSGLLLLRAGRREERGPERSPAVLGEEA